MSAINITVKDGKVSLDYEEKTLENIESRLKLLKQLLGTNWYGVAVIFNLEPTENNVRLMRRWYADPSKVANAREMPENSWKLLLAITSGQDSLTNF